MNYLHVGYPKCGSSFLQNSYFTQENGFCNLLIHAPHEFLAFIKHGFLIPDSMSYSGTLPAITDHLSFETNAVVPNQKYHETPSNNAVLAMRTLKNLFRHAHGLCMMCIQPSYNVGPGRGRVDNVVLPMEGNRRVNVRKWSKRIARIMPKFGRRINNRQSYCEGYEDRLLECFGESNRRLRELTGLDLGKYNSPGV